MAAPFVSPSVVALMGRNADGFCEVHCESGKLLVITHHWNPDTLAYEVDTPSGGDGAGGEVEVTNFPASQAVTGPLTDDQLRAQAVPVSGTVAVSGQVAVTGTFWQTTQPISAASLPLPTDAATEATLSAVSDKLPALEGGRIPVVLPAGGGGLTDTELRATAVPVSGTVAVSGSVAVTGPLTDALLRATPVPISMGGNAVTYVSLKSAAPTANAVQADTGQLAAGTYDFDVHLAVADTVAVGKGLVIEHRNAANNANVNVLGGCTPNGGAVSLCIRRLTLAANERIRVIAGTAAGAASSMYVSAIGRRLS